MVIQADADSVLGRTFPMTLDGSLVALKAPLILEDAMPAAIYLVKCNQEKILCALTIMRFAIDLPALRHIMAQLLQIGHCAIGERTGIQIAGCA
jgi:hypothetical protein